MRGRAVRLLQRRLAALKYYPGRVDGRFGSDTLEAVWAFQDAQGLHPQGAVSPAMQRALASPRHRNRRNHTPNGASLPEKG